jgi:hypothetical protein
MTEALRTQWRVEQHEHRYPAGGGKCDRVLELTDNARVWIEVKLAWRTWFFEVRKDNESFYYEGYFTGRNHSHSVAGDFAKLERITSQHGRYVALILVGFDADDAQMDLDMAQLVESEGLEQRGWHLLSDSWVTSQSAECWHRCWFAWRATE